VFGWGTIIFQSYPSVEKQGSNLTCEIIFRTMLLYLRVQGKRHLRNLYIQFDNYSINKNHILLAAMGSLVLLGMLFWYLKLCSFIFEY